MAGSRKALKEPGKAGRPRGSKEISPLVRGAFRLVLQRRAGAQGSSVEALADFLEKGLYYGGDDPTPEDMSVRISMFKAAASFKETSVTVRGQVSVDHTVAIEGAAALHAALTGVARQAGLIEGELVDVPMLAHDVVEEAVLEADEEDEDDNAPLILGGDYESAYPPSQPLYVGEPIKPNPPADPPADPPRPRRR